MAPLSIASVRRIAWFLGVLPVLAISVCIWSDRFIAADPARVMTIGEAWSAGMIQGFFLLNFLLIVAAFGVWHLRSWARWVAFLWFPALAANNIITEILHTNSVQAESWFNAVAISAIWICGLYPSLASRQATAIFRGANA